MAATIEEALSQCGVTATTLSSDEKDRLDRVGYLVFPDLIEPAWLGRLRDAFDAAASRPTPSSGRSESGTRHLGDLALKDATFDGVYTDPRVLAAGHQILERPFRLFQLSGRDPLPGYGQQGLHVDWMPRRAFEPFAVVTSIWLLDDFTEDNGATRIVPGSHRNPRPLPKSMQAPEQHHPGEQLILAQAGSVLVFNGHLWHSGTRNSSNASRRALQCQFVARELAPPRILAEEIPERVPHFARYILGV